MIALGERKIDDVDGGKGSIGGGRSRVDGLGVSLGMPSIQRLTLRSWFQHSAVRSMGPASGCCA